MLWAIFSPWLNTIWPECSRHTIYSILLSSTKENSLLNFDQKLIIVQLTISLIWDYEIAEQEKSRCLTHWGRVTHICVGNLTIIGSDNGLSPGRRQAIIWTNAGILLIGPLGTNFIETLIEIHTFSFKKIHLKMLSGKCWPCCLGLNVLNWWSDDKRGHWRIMASLRDNMLTSNCRVRFIIGN